MVFSEYVLLYSFHAHIYGHDTVTSELSSLLDWEPSSPSSSTHSSPVLAIRLFAHAPPLMAPMDPQLTMFALISSALESSAPIVPFDQPMTLDQVVLSATPATPVPAPKHNMLTHAQPEVCKLNLKYILHVACPDIPTVP